MLLCFYRLSDMAKIACWWIKYFIEMGDMLLWLLFKKGKLNKFCAVILDIFLGSTALLFNVVISMTALFETLTEAIPL